MKKHLTETEKKGIKIVVFVAITLLLSIILPASAAMTTVSIQDVSIGVGESTVVPIMIYDVENVKGAHFLLSYNSSVVHVEDIGNSDFNFETYKDINNSAGYTRYAVMHVTTNMSGLTGDVKFADVTLKAVGNAGESSPLNIDVVRMLNNESEEIPTEVDNGTFSIKEDVSVSITPANYDFGLLRLNETKTTGTEGYFTLTNDGNVPVDFIIQASNATTANGYTWILADTNGPDQYALEYSKDGGTHWYSISLEPQTIATNIYPNANITIDLRITTPTSTSTHQQFSFVVTVGAVES